VELEPFARLAASHIALWDIAKRREDAQIGFQEFLTLLQVEWSSDQSLSILMKAAQQAGFDRIRVFDYSFSRNSFICREMLGVEKNIRGVEISAEKNVFARHTRQTAVSDVSARVYGPNQPPWCSYVRGKNYLPELAQADPDADRLIKPDDIPWAVVPLVVSGELCGQIVADNALTRRGITRDSVNYLTLIGALAAQVIANDRMVCLLNTGAFEMLTDNLCIAGPTDRLIQQLLIYATCGDALGFSRALFFAPTRDTSGDLVLVYKAGLGSVTWQRHEFVAQFARQKGIGWLMENAGELVDSEIEKQLKSLRIHDADPIVKALLDDKLAAVKFCDFSDGHELPAWLESVKDRLSAERVFVVGLRSAEHVWGLMILDRQWQEHPPSPELDRKNLSAFSGHVSRVLDKHRSLSQKKGP
jgi:hypothetical protein